MRVHIGASWRTRLHDPYATMMRLIMPPPYVAILE